MLDEKKISLSRGLEITGIFRSLEDVNLVLKLLTYED